MQTELSHTHSMGIVTGRRVTGVRRTARPMQPNDARECPPLIRLLRPALESGWPAYLSHPTPCAPVRLFDLWLGVVEDTPYFMNSRCVLIRSPILCAKNRGFLVENLSSVVPEELAMLGATERGTRLQLPLGRQEEWRELNTCVPT